MKNDDEKATLLKLISVETDQKHKGSHLTRALAVIEKVALSERPLTPTEINNELQLPKATIHRLCQFLEDEQFLQRDLEAKRLIPGLRLRQIALGVFRNDQFRLERTVVLQNLSEDIGETCNISVPDGMQMRYVDRAESHWPLRMQLPVGTKVPLYCTSSGKLYLSTLQEGKLDKLIGSFRLEAHTSNTLTSQQALKQELDQIRKEGVGTDREEFLEGMVCVAVPILDQQQRFFATLSFHAPSSRLSLEEGLGYVPRLREASTELSSLLKEESR